MTRTPADVAAELAELTRLLVENLGHPVGMGIGLPAAVEARMIEEYAAIIARHFPTPPTPGAEVERRKGNSKLIYDKDRRTIVRVDSDGKSTPALSTLPDRYAEGVRDGREEAAKWLIYEAVEWETNPELRRNAAMTKVADDRARYNRFGATAIRALPEPKRKGEG